MIREIVLDTETTGLDPASDRVIEIGCVELVNHVPSGRIYQAYLNPERSMSSEAEMVHGIRLADLQDKPRFGDEAENFLAFIGDARLIAHNAGFDFGFLNAELARLHRPLLSSERMVDTVALAKRKIPAGQYSLDALCARFGVDTSRRTLHGALLDAQLLADVYVELIGGRQMAFGLGEVEAEIEAEIAVVAALALPRPTPLPARLTALERDAHAVLIGGIGNKALWLAYQPVAAAAE